MNQTIPIPPKYPTIPMEMIIDYEIRSSWWACWIGWDWGQALSGKYFAWKTRQKYARYKTSKMWEHRIGSSK